MSWTGEAYAEAERRDRADTDWYALSAESLFAEGAEWLRNQLRTDEAVELVARVFYENTTHHILTRNGWEDASDDAREDSLDDARAAITALLGDN